MKPVREFFIGFTRMERIGFSVLSVLLVLSFAFRFWIAFQMKDHPHSDEEKRLAFIYDEWRMENDHSTENSSLINEQNSQPFYFDPNKLDSAGFIQLGMPVKAVHGLLNWRRKGKKFRKPEDLAPLYNLPTELYARLKPFIRIEITEDPAFQHTQPAFSLPKIIELNTADSALLDRAISGVGPALAHRIVERRNALGGFLSFDQLKEIYRFPDSTFIKIKERLTLDPHKIMHINLNEANEEILSRHPYIGERIARNILLYRQGIGHYSGIEQLRQVPLMSEEIYRKIAPYFIIK
jgi:DNA uptake protein ComE-like DNA-binding protein